MPPSINATFSQTSLTTSIWWVTITIVIPNSLFIFDKSANISFVILGSKADVASSQSKILGSNAKALAIATLCFCPPLKLDGFTSAFSERPTKFKSSVTLSFIFSFLNFL